ncbi:unnamed protein product, partial [Dibothriocephalus latus]
MLHSFGIPEQPQPFACSTKTLSTPPGLVIHKPFSSPLLPTTPVLLPPRCRPKNHLQRKRRRAWKECCGQLLAAPTPCHRQIHPKSRPNAFSPPRLLTSGQRSRLLSLTLSQRQS